MSKLATLFVSAVLGSSLAIGSSAAFSAPTGSTKMTVVSSVNKAGRQRMLSQRIVQLYCQAGQGVRTGKSAQQLRDTVSQFDGQLGELKAFVLQPEIKDALNKMETTWIPFKEMALKTPDQANADKLNKMSDQLLGDAHGATMMLQDYAGTAAGSIVNLSGRQRMLSQKIAKIYMLKQWGISNSSMESDLVQSRTEFKGAMMELESAKESSSAIKHELAQVKTQWNNLEKALNKKEGNAEVVAEASERILEGMDKITAMYENGNVDEPSQSAKEAPKETEKAKSKHAVKNNPVIPEPAPVVRKRLPSDVEFGTMK